MKALCTRVISLVVFTFLLTNLAHATTHIKFKIKSQPYHNLIIFGDSLSDIKGKATNNSPNGKKLWGEFLYEQLGDKLQLHNGIYSQPESLQNPACENANNCNIVYAVGGNTTKNLAAQIERYKKQLNGQMANDNTIVFIWLGGNDFHAFANFTDTPGAAVDRIRDGIDVLTHDLKVKPSHIYLLNLPNIGKMPLLAGETFFDKAKQTTAATTSIIYKDLINTAAKDKGVRVIDIHAFDANIHANLLGYGYDVDATHNRYSCNNKAQDKQNCTSAAGYFMYYDNVHPTVYTHQLIANYIVQNL